MFQDLSQRSIETGFWRICDAAQFHKIRTLNLSLREGEKNLKIKKNYGIGKTELMAEGRLSTDTGQSALYLLQFF